VHSVPGVLAVASLAFLGTMFDNFFAFAAQLSATERERHSRVGWAQALGVASLVVVASAAGSALTPVPTRVIGLLCVVPWALAIYAWRHRQRPPSQASRRGVLTTYASTLVMGGDNLAVWIPLLRVVGLAKSVVTLFAFVVWELLFVAGAASLARHPRAVAWGRRRTPALVPFVYVALGLLILYEAGTFA
jgi:cadmium resistance protein CadD (predicted permease)